MCRHRIFPQWFIEELARVEDKEKAKKGILSTTSYVDFLCPCGKVYNQKVSNHVNLSTGERKFGSCQECRKKKIGNSYRKTSGTYKPYPQWFIDELKNGEDKDKAKQGTLLSSDLIEFICPVCGNVYVQRVSSHIKLSTGEKKKSCPICGIDKQRKSRLRNTYKPYPQWFIDELYTVEDKETAKCSNFFGKDIKQFYCKKHCVLYSKKVRDVIDLNTYSPKSTCPKCSLEKQLNTYRENKKKNYPQWFIDDLYNKNDKVRASEGFLSQKEQVDFFCPKHNLVYRNTVYSHINPRTMERKQICPLCSKENKKRKLEENREYPDWFIEDLVYDEDKENAKSGVLKTSDFATFRCDNNHVYTQAVKSHIILSRNERYKGCPICFPNRSKEEKEIEEFIKGLGIYVEHKKFFVNNKESFEIDIFLPSKNIGIEYNGSYWHSSLPVLDHSKDKYYHNKKYWRCSELGIRLISIFDVDWIHKKEKIKQYLKDSLLPILNRVYARECTVCKVDSTDSDLFLEQNHLLGKTTNKSLSYGLYYKEHLVSCMSFQKGRYKENKESVWCLTRFVNKSNFIVVGGASKLLKTFETEYKPSILISYSDNDYFSGNLYSKLGFRCLGDTCSPRYYWYFKGKEIKRESCQLNKLAKKYPSLFKESLSQTEYKNKEDYIMTRLGAFKVYRSGHTKWKKQKEKF